MSTPRACVFALAALTFVSLSAAAPARISQGAQAPASVAAGSTFDTTIPPGANFDKANFRLWLPAGVSTVHAVVVLVPGSNGDGRGESADPAWQAFATKHNLALVGCQLTDKPHDQNFIEEYVNVSRGSGEAFLSALGRLGADSKHPEIASAPLFLWGMSAGGQFNYEFNAWKPERVAAFVVNKGGIYYSALVSKAARDVPGMLYIGGKDLESRVGTITGLFLLNRRGGALWALAEEPAATHIVGKSKDLTMMFFEDVMPTRLSDAPGGPLKAIDPKSGFIGDYHAKTFAAAADAKAGSATTVWLPTERVAKAWVAMMREEALGK